MASIASFLPPNTIRTLVRSNEYYSTNRDRAGAALHDGFAVWDTYVEMRPGLFVLGLLGMAGSAWVGYNRRHTGWESKALYATSFVASAALAWFTRPGVFGGAATASEEEAAAGAGMVGYLDGRAAELKQQDPFFADKAFERLVNSPGVKPTWDRTDPAIQAFVV